MNHNSILTLLITLALAGPASTAVGEVSPGATWISVAPTGLAYDGPPAELTLELSLDGTALASTSRSFDGSKAPAQLATLVAEARYDGKLADHELGIRLTNGDEMLLEIRGQPTGAVGALALRVTGVDYPANSRVHATGPIIFQVEHGWNDETLTVGFAWRDAPAGAISVLLEAEGDGTAIMEETNATALNGTAWKASFHLDRLPAILVWKATILVNGEPAGTTGSTVSFPTRTASDGYFAPAPGSDLVAAGGFHEVGGHKEVISIDRGLLAPVFEGSSDCPAKGAYDTVNGESWRIASLASRADACHGQALFEEMDDYGPGDSLTAAAIKTDEPESASSLAPILVVKILAGVLAALFVVYVVIARRRRRGT